ncbi:MAG: CBS domain-containing protein [Nitrospirae bacterium]|nr:CBS domain-containing protein [Nitrospirota bacterium]
MDRADSLSDSRRPDVSDQDILEAMKEIQGYLDITPADFQEIYSRAFRHALDRIAGAVKARDVMTRGVISARVDDSLDLVAELMAREGIAGLPVVDDSGRVVGVISEKDFLALMGGSDRRHFMAVIALCLKGKGCAAAHIKAKKAGDLMSSPAVTVSEDTSVKTIAQLFMERHINRVPVVDEGGALVGLVSRSDIVRAATFGEAGE